MAGCDAHDDTNDRASKAFVDVDASRMCSITHCQA